MSDRPDLDKAIEIAQAGGLKITGGKYAPKNTSLAANEPFTENETKEILAKLENTGTSLLSDDIKNAEGWKYIGLVIQLLETLGGDLIIEFGDTEYTLRLSQQKTPTRRQDNAH